MNERSLKYVYKSLLWWIYTLSIIYLFFIFSIFLKHALELSDILNPASAKDTIYCGTFNKHLFTPLSVGIIVSLCFTLVGIMIYVSNIESKSETFLKIQFIVFTIANITLLGVYIGTTGCFLNSPFSGAIAVYLANIMTLYNNDNLSKNKSILMIISIFVFSILILSIPYLFSFYNDNSLFIFDWSNQNYIIILRLALTFLILIITTISSFKTGKKLAEISVAERSY